MLIAVAAVNPAAAYPAAALATLGSVIGCLILFYIARKGGERYLDRHVRSARALKFRRWIRRYGLATVFVPALSPVPLPTKVFVVSAGALGVGIWRFTGVVLAARVLRYFGLAYLGSHLGTDSGAWLGSHAWHIAGVALAVFLLVAVVVHIVEGERDPVG